MSIPLLKPNETPERSAPYRYCTIQLHYKILIYSRTIDIYMCICLTDVIILVT